MNYKVEKMIKDNKKYIVTFIIIWLVVEILLVSPLSVSISLNLVNGKLNVDKFFTQFIKELTSFTSFTRIFHITTIGIFAKYTVWTTIIFGVFIMIGSLKSKPKNEFTDIEHGSSDWSEGGEQYKILDKRKGIILAENNYLPLNKLGNVNVLVVGRIWIW